MLAIDCIYKEIGALGTNERISTAITLMDEQKINHLAIVEGNTFLGLISENSIFELNSFSDRISNHLTLLKKIFVYENQHIYEIAKLTYFEQIDIIPVLDKNENYLGCITLSKLLDAFTQLTSATEEGSVLMLSMNVNDLYISEIARIIESNDARIINLYVTPVMHSTEIKVTIKINKTDLSRIIQTLNRYNYTVNMISEPNPIEGNLVEKYKLLMKYLSI